MKFEEVLREIIIEKDTSIQKISKETGIDDSVLYDYLHGSIPNVDYAMVLANYFDCSLNYLMGIDSEYKSIKFRTSYNIKVFSERYDALLEENKVSHYKICREKGLNYSSHYGWRRGATPSMTSLKIIAEYFCVSIDYLVGRTDEK